MRIKDLFENQWILLAIFLILVVSSSLVKYSIAPVEIDGIKHTKYNNYLIFKSSFNHLVQQEDLYVLHPEDHFDYFKYSPSFAFLMFPFNWLPDSVGLIFWNLLNALLLFFAIQALPRLDRNVKVYMLWFVLLELLTSLQNAQSNGLMAGLFIFAFVAFEKRNVALASLFLVLSVYIKLFGIVAFILFLFYEKRLKFVGYALIWTILIGLLPLLIVRPEHLTFLYSGWGKLLLADQTVSYGQSVMGIFHAFLKISLPKYFILLAGVILLSLPLLQLKSYPKYGFRLLFLSSLLIWVVIFNHKAESPTYIIAMSGVAIWFFSQKINSLNLTLAVFAIFITSISPTDLFPAYLRKEFILPFQLKALPCIIIWLKIEYELISNHYRVITVNGR